MNIATLRSPRKTDCPSCGAEVEFQSRVSVQVVCGFCRSTLVRNDLGWEDIGKMSALANDLSPVRLGMHGKIDKTGFTVIGRLQKQHEDGIWNEWLLSLDNNQSAWLGEGSGLFYLTTAINNAEPLPGFMSLKPGQSVKLDGKKYSVTDIERAICIAAEGEIPFRIAPGGAANAADLVSVNGMYATIDYSEYPPRVYMGRILKQSELYLDGADAIPADKTFTAELRCSGCGNAMTVRNPATVTVACASCYKVFTKSPRGKLISAFDQAVKSMKPRLPLESRGRLQGHEFEIVGWMRRSTSGDSWDEYLLYNASQGVHWLIESDGHWTLMSPVTTPPENNIGTTASIRFQGDRYAHFATYGASVVAVLGEFYWRVRKDEHWQCTDYISPPQVLCREVSSKEVTWSHGTYLAPSEIMSGFSLKSLPAQRGVGINQPAPRISHFLLTYVVTIILAWVIGSYIDGLRHPKTIDLGQLYLNGDSNNAKLVTDPFTLDSANGLLRINTSTNISNHWVGFDYTVVNQDSGEAREMYREVSQYSGQDSEGYWSEGNSSDSAYLSNVQAGHYVIEVNAQTDSYNWRSERRPDISIGIRAEHARSNGKNLWLLFWLLAIGPAVAGLRRYFFEQKRWQTSDHPWVDE